MPPKTVPDDGPLDAQLVVVGEAPSTVEVARRRPFVGPSGGKLAEWWKRPEINLHRKDIYITNVLPYMVQKIPRGGVHGLKITVAEWNEAITALHNRLGRLENPRLIVAVGDIALQALRGHGGILKWRGSVLGYLPRDVRLIPTVHPAALFRDPSLERRCIADWQKIANELRSPSPETWKEAKHHIAPSWHEVQAFRQRVERFSEENFSGASRPRDFRETDRALSHVADGMVARPRLAIDIETPRKTKTVAALTPKLKRPTTKTIPGRPFIGCIGFALSPDESITIPTMPAYWKQYGVTMEQVWQEIAAICESRLEKVLQNGFFDAFYLARDRSVLKHLGRGIRLRNYKHDTLAKHHVLDASEEHSLAYINSIYGRHPYWKDDGKQPGDLRGVPPDLEKWWLYNGTDATETHYLDARLDEAMTPEQRQFYKDHYQKCFQPIMQMMHDGICVDEEKRATRFAELRAKAERLRTKINAAASTELMGTKSISSTKLKTYLYETLKLPKQFAKNAKKEKVVSAGEIQLKRLMNLFPKHEQLQKVGRLVLKFRRADKLSTFYAEKIADSDGRARCTYTFETDTGRLSSRQNPMGGGANHQNPDGSSLDIYVADPGGIFIECDLSQAESRLVYVFTGDPELIEVARSLPWEYDSHTVNTAHILGISESEVTKEQRKNIGKPTVHACVDGETEVLTHNGWVRFDELSDPLMPIAIWDAKTKAIHFRVPDKLHCYPAPATLMEVSGRAIVQLVTQNHRLPYASNGKIKESPASDFIQKQEPRIPTSGFYEGTRHAPELLRLAAAIQADGHIPYGDRVQFHFKKARKIQRIQELLRACNIEWKLSTYKDGSTYVRATIPGAAGVKFFGPWLLEYDGESLDAFLAEVRHWDGSFVERHLHKRETYNSALRENVDWVQTILHLRNKRGTIRRSKRCWRLSIANRQFARVDTVLKVPSVVDKVYCVTVPTGFFLIRRHGKISVTGNSHYMMMGATMSDSMLRHGVIMTPEECQGHINAYMTWRHQVPVWQQRIKWEVIDKRQLTNSWGRVADFRYMRLQPHLYQKACNFRPQSEVAGLINQYGMIPIRKAIRVESRPHRLRLQKHDSLAYWSPWDLDNVWWIVQTIYRELEKPRVYDGVELTIPVGMKIGLNLGEMVEFKKPPTKKEVRLALEALREA